MMNQADYETIASVLAEINREDSLWDIAADMATQLCASNPTFDPLRFMAMVMGHPVGVESLANHSHALGLRLDAMAAKEERRKRMAQAG
jgi:hypothetical protein